MIHNDIPASADGTIAHPGAAAEGGPEADAAHGVIAPSVHAEEHAPDSHGEITTGHDEGVIAPSDGGLIAPGGRPE